MDVFAWLLDSDPAIRWQVLRDLRDAPLEEAIHLLESKRQHNGTWLLENTHPGKIHFPLEDGDGHPSRWNTLRALRVLRWYRKKAA